LAKKGCQVHPSWLGRWWRARRNRSHAEELLDVIHRSAHQCLRLEKAFADGRTPDLELLIQIHRVLLLNLSADASVEPAILDRLTRVMKTILSWACLHEKRRIRELNEQKYRDQVAAQKAAIERELNAAKDSGGISPQTLERVERELKLL
jgi:hypothetical protein